VTKAVHVGSGVIYRAPSSLTIRLQANRDPRDRDTVRSRNEATGLRVEFDDSLYRVPFVAHYFPVDSGQAKFGLSSPRRVPS
jgi:hypothetical protein